MGGGAPTAAHTALIIMRRSAIAQRSGAALMLALWALFLLSAMVIAWALDVDSRLTLSGNASRVVEAEAMASSGAEVALSPTVKTGSSVLHGSLGQNQTYNAQITGEGGRLDLNWILAGENPQRLAVLRQYLEVKGIDLNERDRMMDCLLDYVDPDDLPRLNGAESEPGYQPKNSLLQRIEELKEVKGWEKFTARPDWDADFTLYSTGPELISSGLRAMSCSLCPASTNKWSIAFWSFGAARIKSMAQRTIRTSNRSIRKGLRSDSRRSNLRSFPPARIQRSGHACR